MSSVTTNSEDQMSDTVLGATVKTTDNLDEVNSNPLSVSSATASHPVHEASYHHTPVSIQGEIEAFGKEIFKLIGSKSPSIYSKSFWSQLMMRWTMKNPALKSDLFRLVDVLPNLRSSSAVTHHIQEYISRHADSMPRLARWLISRPADSRQSDVIAFFVRRGVKEMAQQFIAGETPMAARKSLRRLRRSKLAYTVDLLGEYTLSESEALEYFDRYKDALAVLGQESHKKRSYHKPIIENHPGDLRSNCVSIKLSALYSQCNVLNFDKSVEVLAERLSSLVELAEIANTQIYVDAEDSGTNGIIYATFEKVFGSEKFKNVQYPGIVVQAYAKSAVETTERLLAFAKRRGSPIAIRLVKGAYWDIETITSALNDWPSPLLLKKESSDAQFEYISRKILDAHEHCLPAFASHNVRSLSHAVCYAEAKGLKKNQFELQMLYGMAEPIARAFVEKGYLVRLYVPLGDLFVGMGYLVRRLLENTSNESFLKHTFFDHDAITELLKEPCFQD